jgi:hypothetical protein
MYSVSVHLAPMKSPAASKRRKRRRSSSPESKRRLAHCRCIDDLAVAQPAFLRAFEIALKQLEIVFPSRYRRLNLLRHNPKNSMGSFYVRNRLLLIKAGPLSAVLAQRLLSATVGNRCVVNDAFKLGAALLSQSHKFDEAPPTRVAAPCSCGWSARTPPFCFRRGLPSIISSFAGNRR